MFPALEPLGVELSTPALLNWLRLQNRDLPKSLKRWHSLVA